MFGSATTWNGLLAAGLVDELHLMVAPVFLGAGDRAFRGTPDAVAMPQFGAAPLMELRSTRRFDGSDTLLVTYGVR